MENPLLAIVNTSAPAHIKRSFDHVPVVTVMPSAPLRFRPLWPVWWGTELHHDGRSFLCTGKQHCNGCRAQLGKRWAGWWSVCSWDYRSSWVVKVSAGAAKQLESLSEVRQSLVGLPICFRRAVSRSNAKVVVEVTEGMDCDFDRLPPAIDPRGVVLFLHGVDDDTIRTLLAMPDGQRWTSRTR